MKRYWSLAWILLLALLPLELAGLYALTVEAYGLVRYDPAYFAETYLGQYGTLPEAARALERALRSDNQALLAELQGLRWPARLKTSPSLSFTKLLERTDRYVTYLYLDERTYERHPHHFEQVKGRWVVSPTDAYYFLHSGRWQEIFLRIAVIWWSLGAAVIGAIWIFRASRRIRTRLYGEE